MIQAIVKRYGGGRYTIKVSGHSGYASRGNDIVCAAVSAIVQTAVLGLEATPGLSLRQAVDEEAGELECSITHVECGTAGLQAEAIVKTMILGLRSVEAGHDKYLTVNLSDIEEVFTCS